MLEVFPSSSENKAFSDYQKILLFPRDIFDWWNNISDLKSERGSTYDYENSKFIIKMIEVNNFSITFI